MQSLIDLVETPSPKGLGYDGGSIKSSKPRESSIFDLIETGFDYIPGHTISDSFVKDAIDFRETWDNLGHDEYFGVPGVRWRAHDHFYFSGPNAKPKKLPHLPFILDEIADNEYHGRERYFQALEDPENPQLRSFLMYMREHYLSRFTRTPEIATVVQFRTIVPPGEKLEVSDGGPHQDGFRAVSLTTMHRDSHSKGGHSQVYRKGSKEPLLDKAPSEPWSTIIVDDKRLLHHATPMVSTHPRNAAVRDMLIVDWSSVNNMVPALRRKLKEMIKRDKKCLEDDDLKALHDRIKVPHYPFVNKG